MSAELGVVRVLLLVIAVTTVVGSTNIVCYFGSWANYRPGHGRFVVEDIDPFLCTHAIYAFVGINANGTLRILDPWLDLEDDWGLGAMRRFNDLKFRNPALKTLVAVGGWNEGSDTFSTVASSPVLREHFANDVVEFLLRHGFDGFDVDWEYPGQGGGNPAADRENFVLLLRDLRQQLQPRGLLLTAAVGASENLASISYNIPAISEQLDQINLMTYDFRGPWEAITGHNAPVYPGPYDSVFQQSLNVDASVRYWLAQGAPSNKLNLGIPFYGNSFTLRDVNAHGVGAPADGPGRPGHYTLEDGMLGYNEICENQMTGRWTAVWDATQISAYAYSENQWVSYDNLASVQYKCDLIRRYGLAGGMVWSIETDDFRGTCGRAYGLLSTMNDCLAMKRK